jgi:hypothetical protein
MKHAVHFLLEDEQTLLLATEMVAMDKTPSGDGACCLPNGEGLTYLKVGPRGVTVGMMNLDAGFKQLLAMGRRPEEATDAELLGMARRFNYIPDRSGVEADYAAALRRAYAAFCTRQERRPDST